MYFISNLNVQHKTSPSLVSSTADLGIWQSQNWRPGFSGERPETEGKAAGEWAIQLNNDRWPKWNKLRCKINHLKSQLKLCKGNGLASNMRGWAAASGLMTARVSCSALDKQRPVSNIICRGPERQTEILKVTAEVYNLLVTVSGGSA